VRRQDLFGRDIVRKFAWTTLAIAPSTLCIE
jgi:hypothetical protein